SSGELPSANFLIIDMRKLCRATVPEAKAQKPRTDLRFESKSRRCLVLLWLSKSFTFRPGAIMDFFFTTGQVAKELKCSDQTIRNLCASGQITASRSAGGHYRIAPAELERLRALGELPAVARATISNGARQLKKNPHELLGPPSEQ